MRADTPFTAEYHLAIADASSPEIGSCSVTFSDSGIQVTPQGGVSIDARFSEIVGWLAEDYCIRLNLTDGTELQFLKLARRFDEFTDMFRSCRREHFFKSLLLEEGEHLDLDGAFEQIGLTGEIMASGACAISLQITSLACFPDNSLPFLLPYGAILDMVRDQELYGVRIICDDGRKLVFTRFARRTDELARGLEERRGALAKRQSLAISALAPNLGAMPLRKCASLLRDGVPAGRIELEAAAPGFWDAIWHAGFCEERREYAAALLAKAADAYVVIKETGPWDVAEDTPVALVDRRLLYLFQINSALVVETPSTDDAATYVFRIIGDCRDFTRALCQALAAIQFRREPVYIPEAELQKPPHNRYAEAVRILPALAAARGAFCGRAIHSSLDTWLRNIDEAIAVAGT